jgi:Pyruvate flavodoxin/ferredoxin oxidoreductase, thiamine diP-bdg
MSTPATVNGAPPPSDAGDEKKDEMPTEVSSAKSTLAPPAKTSTTTLLPPGRRVCVDGNYATAHAAYRMNDCAFVFPITPSSPMGEFSDEMANVQHMRNVFGQELKIVELQSEGGAGTCDTTK